MQKGALPEPPAHIKSGMDPKSTTKTETCSKASMAVPLKLNLWYRGHLLYTALHAVGPCLFLA